MVPTKLEKRSVALCAMTALLGGCGPESIEGSLRKEGAASLCDASEGADARGVVSAGPYLQTVDETSATISWETSSTVDAWLEYGPTSALGMRAFPATSTDVRETRLWNLEANRTYHYRIHWGDCVGPDHRFHTASQRDAPFRFAVYGDTQQNPSIHRLVADAILEEHPAFVLHVGDEVQDGDDRDSWAVEYFRPGGRLMSEVPVYAALGNHEKHANWFYEYHSYPAPESYYSFSWGSSLIVVMDSTQDFGEGSDQQVWLRDLLESERARVASFVWIVFHHPAYAEGWSPCDYDGDPNVRGYLMPFLERYSISATLHGHVHGYERGQKNGIYYVITGGGGGDLDHHCTDWPDTAVANYVHHFVTVDVAADWATIRSKDMDGSILDEFRVPRRPQPSQAL